MSNTCKSCGRPIVWAKTTAGKSIPLIANPNTTTRDSLKTRPRVFATAQDWASIGVNDPTGAGRIQLDHLEVTLDDVVTGIVVHALPAGDTPDPDLPVWATHFVDCPQSKEWKRS